MGTAATVYTLILVTAGADLKHSDWPNLHTCLEAKSMAQFGQTIEAKQAADAEEAARWKKLADDAQAQRLREYPPRRPTPEETEEASKSGGEIPSLTHECGKPSFALKSGMVVPGAPHCWSSDSTVIVGHWSSDTSAIMHAECVVEAEPR